MYEDLFDYDGPYKINSVDHNPLSYASSAPSSPPQSPPLLLSPLSIVPLLSVASPSSSPGVHLAISDKMEQHVTFFTWQMIIANFDNNLSIFFFIFTVLKQMFKLFAGTIWLYPMQTTGSLFFVSLANLTKLELDSVNNVITNHHSANGFQIELCHIAHPPKGQGHGGWKSNIPSHVTQHSISICEMETAKSDICSILDILFSWIKKNVWRI